MKNIDKTFEFTSVGTNNKKTQIILTETTQKSIPVIWKMKP